MINRHRWAKTASKLSQIGFGGAVVELPRERSIEENVQKLFKIISQNCFRPPVLVSHSMGTFMSQKYLESYPLTGLVMVNPIPPSSSRAIQQLVARWNSCQAGVDSMEKIASYYRIDKSLASDIQFSEDANGNDLISHEFRKDWLANAQVELEPESVPMLLISTNDDKEVLMETERESIIQYHNIDPDCNILLDKDISRMPMLKSEEIFHEKVLEWIDLIA